MKKKSLKSVLPNSGQSKSSRLEEMSARLLFHMGILLAFLFSISFAKSSSNFKAEGRILTSIVPLKPQVEKSKAEVSLVLNPNPHGEGLVRASSILMEYDEDTRKYFNSTKAHAKRAHRRRHSSQSDAPIETKPYKIRIPAKAVIYSTPGRKRPLHGVVKHPRNQTLISLHSPVKIFIRVKDDPEKEDNSKCIRCPKLVNLTLPEGEKDLEVPLPNISVCSRIAGSRGRLNVAIVSGPHPGVRISKGNYTVEIMLWKQHGRVYECNYTLIVKEPLLEKRICPNPIPPPNGTIVCDNNSSYPAGSVCQYFCYPGFVMDSLLTTSALTICKNGQWTPHQYISCRATYCPVPPLVEHASISCDDNGIKSMSFAEPRYKNGTKCHVLCHAGYRIPYSKKQLGNPIQCEAPDWKDSSILECKQITVPTPHPGDCKNLTVFSNRRGFARVRVPRFYIRDRTVPVKCAYSGNLQLGTYLNLCSAVNPEFDVIGECSYSITVQKNSCPSLPDMPHSVLQCNSRNPGLYPKRTKCQYICDLGYGIPLKQHKLNTKICTSKLTWKPAGIPNCIKASPPKLKKSSCSHRILYLDTNPIPLALPRFKPFSRKSRVKVNCSLSYVHEVGNYTNNCEATDQHYNLISTCTYNITVKANGCENLPAIPFGSINCSQPATNSRYAGGTECRYVCDEGYAIPQNFVLYATKKCTANNQWNATVVPACAADLACEQPSAPSGGYIECPVAHNCSIGCDTGRHFSSEYSELQKGWMECEGLLWDFQRVHQLHHLPDCLGELPNTVVEVWLSFSATAENCEDNTKNTVKDLAIRLNAEKCKKVDCDSSFQMNCTVFEDKVLLNFTWILQAQFSPSDYAESDSVLDYETDIESILERTQKAITLEGTFPGGEDVHLVRDSYRRSFFTLICKEAGYAVDNKTLKCVECPSGTMQKKDVCVKCPRGQHQPNSGQTSCIEWSSH